MTTSEPNPRAARGALHRWGAPLAIVWAGLLLSAFVFERRLPEAVTRAPSPLLVTLLLGCPGASLLALFGLRRLDADPERRSAPGDALVAWLLAAMFAAHALILAVVAGALPSLHPGLALVAGFLLLGLAALLPSLPVGCPFGLLTAATRSDPARWAAVHRELAVGAGLSGGLALAAALAPSGPWTPAALVPVGVAILRGLRRPSPPRESEHAAPSQRPSGPDENRSP